MDELIRQDTGPRNCFKGIYLLSQDTLRDLGSGVLVHPSVVNDHVVQGYLVRGWGFMGHSLRKAIACLLAIAILSFTSPVVQSDAGTPESLIEAFHGDLLSVMKEGENLGIKGRYDRILTYIDKYFHMPLMVMFVTGEHWKNAPREARHSALRAARRFSAGEMAVLFSSHSGETFETVRTRSIQDKSVLVETNLNRLDDSPVKVIYRMKKFRDSWRIIDVLLDGSISQLLKRRGEYRRTLANEGLVGLTELLNQKAEEMLADKTN